jgi:2-keto-4-pentenoate hydratase/2-oxohepta-3-ene-1,7-dioic acid hydratase in catechol pathway
MKLATILYNQQPCASIQTDFGILPVPVLNQNFNTNWSEDLYKILTDGQLDPLKQWYDQQEIGSSQAIKHLAIPKDQVVFLPLYRHPRKIWGIGLNYKAHAEDLSEQTPTQEPASFMKPDTTIIGHKDTIKLPKLSHKTTGEAELGLIFSKTCKDVKRDDWRSVLAGFTTIIDMTAEDILRRNPRNLTQSKSFDTFFSFGPILYTVDEIKDVHVLKVQTCLNGKVCAENSVANMTFPPEVLVSYHSQLMTFLPGDIISTGTPGAVALTHGDIIECRITGFEPLINPVVDLKSQKEDV